MLTVILTLCFSMVPFTMAAQDETIVFTPQWTAQAQFAGYYVAEAKGFYREAGVKVRIEHPTPTQPAMARLQQNRCQATTLQLCQAFKQKGARVGIWSVGFGQLAICMSIMDHLNYEFVRFAQNVNLFVAGALDATLAMSYNEYYQLVQAGITVTDKNVYRFCDHGYNVQEDGVYMARSYYEKHRDKAMRFAQASKKGWEYAVKHPDEALDIVMKYVDREKIGTNRVMQQLMLKEVLRLQVDRESKKREFRLRPDMVKRASHLMVQNRMLDREVTYQELIAK